MEKKTEKKKGNAGIIDLILFLLIPIAAAVFLYNTEAGYFLKCHISKDPRMYCEVVMQLDGAPCPLTAAQVTGLPMDSGAENKVSDVESDASGCSFLCKGGEYGAQPFQITFSYGDGQTAVISVEPVIGADWEMTDLVLTIQADSATETYTYSATLYVNGRAYKSAGEAAFDSEDSIRVSDI